MDFRKYAKYLSSDLFQFLTDIEKGIGIEVKELPPKNLMPIGARFIIEEEGVKKEYIKLRDGEYHLLGGGGSSTDAREIELQKSATHIQWRYVDDAEWTNLVALTEITGTNGTNGINGNNGADGQGIDHVEFTSTTAISGLANEPGETDTYTVWGDVGETIDLGTFTVYNGADGGGTGSGVQLYTFSSFSDLINDTTAVDGDYGKVTATGYYYLRLDSKWFNLAPPLTQVVNFAVSEDTYLWLRFENDCNDSSGNSRNGTPTSITYQAGEVGFCAIFNGSSSKVNLPNANITTSGLTIMAWVNASQISGLDDGKIVDIKGSSNRVVLGLTAVSSWDGSNKFFADIVAGGSLYSRIMTNAIFGSWCHLAFVYDGTNLHFYLNGTLLSSVAAPASLTLDSYLEVGNEAGDVASRYFLGNIDEVIIETRAWLGGEISSYYNLN